jgi:hypothetical protein
MVGNNADGTFTQPPPKPMPDMGSDVVPPSTRFQPNLRGQSGAIDLSIITDLFGEGTKGKANAASKAPQRSRFRINSFYGVQQHFLGDVLPTGNERLRSAVFGDLEYFEQTASTGSQYIDLRDSKTGESLTIRVADHFAPGGGGYRVSETLGSGRAERPDYNIVRGKIYEWSNETATGFKQISAEQFRDELSGWREAFQKANPAIADGAAGIKTAADKSGIPAEQAGRGSALTQDSQQQATANVNRQSAAAPRGQAMPDITITPDEARRQGLVGPVYHGSPDFKGGKFDPKYRARSSGLSRGGFSFTDDAASANSYAKAGVDSAQAAVDAANDVMRDLGARMEKGLKLREFADISELPEFNVRYVDDMDGLASYFNDLSKRIPKDLGARLRGAARAMNEPANPVVVEAYLRNPKEMMIDGKRLLVAEKPDDIFVSAAQRPQQ